MEPKQVHRKRCKRWSHPCITKDNYHATPCPHRDYIKNLIEKIGMDYREDTVISEKSQQRWTEGVYQES